MELMSSPVTRNKTIKISNEAYTGKQLENYLNTFVLSTPPLNRIGKYDESKKI